MTIMFIFLTLMTATPETLAEVVFTALQRKN